MPNPTSQFKRQKNPTEVLDAGRVAILKCLGIVFKIDPEVQAMSSEPRISPLLFSMFG